MSMVYVEHARIKSNVLIEFYFENCLKNLISYFDCRFMPLLLWPALIIIIIINNITIINNTKK